MSWIKEDYEYSLMQKLCMSILSKGAIPKHIAIIMDGNRRYATKNSLEKVEGHSMGFIKLSETLQWCRDMNIREVSVYAFSIHNFRRESEEVTYLMNLAREKFKKILEERCLFEKHQVKVRIIGNLRLLPEDIQDSARKVMKLTAVYNRFVLNVCMAYTSHDEIQHSLNIIRRGVNQGFINESDISADLVGQCLYLSARDDQSVDLLIRTSGETRLSDFLVWQCRHSNVRFIDSFWPDFTVWHFLAAVFQYQKSLIVDGTQISQSQSDVKVIDDPDSSSRVNRFMEFVDSQFQNWMNNNSDEFFM